MGQLSHGEIAHRLTGLVDVLAPSDRDQIVDVMWRAFTRDGKIDLSKAHGFLDPARIATDEAESGVVVEINFANVLANDFIDSSPITVPGARLLDAVVIGVAPTFNAGLVPIGIVTANDQVVIRLMNVTTGSLNPATLDYRITLAR